MQQLLFRAHFAALSSGRQGRQASTGRRTITSFLSLILFSLFFFNLSSRSRPASCRDGQKENNDRRTDGQTGLFLYPLGEQYSLSTQLMRSGCGQGGLWCREWWQRDGQDVNTVNDWRKLYSSLPRLVVTTHFFHRVFLRDISLFHS